MNLIDLFLKEGKQYLMDAMPGGALNREVTPQGLLDVTALATAPIPVVGDIAGGVADAKRLYDNPEERTPMNIGLSALGLLPFIPGATVFHGTPHLFNKFDASKIGTGEGAQAFGHGLYLAEAPGVAKEYSKLDPAGGAIPSPVRMIKGAQVQPGTGAYKAASLLDSMTLAQAKKTAKGWAETSRPEETAYFSEVLDTLNSIGGKRDVRISNKKPPGYLYQVDLPDEQIAKMLDWDKPLSQQSSEVQKALAGMGYKVDKKEVDAYSDSLLDALMSDAPAALGKQPLDMSGESIYRQLTKNASSINTLTKQRDSLVGKYQKGNMSMADAVRAMNAEDRAQFSRIADQIDNTKNSAAVVSEALRQAGIPGIRYLDQGSRAAPNITNKRLADLYAKHGGNADAAVDEMMQSVYNTPKKKEAMREQFMKQLQTPKTSNFVVFPGMEDMLRIEQINNQPVESLFRSLGR